MLRSRVSTRTRDPPQCLSRRRVGACVARGSISCSAWPEGDATRVRCEGAPKTTHTHKLRCLQRTRGK
jgi:hypothetical protein